MLSNEDRNNIVRFRIENADTTLAESLEQIGFGYYNTAVNRMYYACYYAASALLITNGIVTKTHDGVLQMLSLHFIKTGILPVEYGKIYRNLFDKRSSGDYEDFFYHTKESAEALFPDAKNFVERIKNLVWEWLEAQKEK
ncbi:MAG: HEPN domain-containing protein [Bacteroidales bacterium]|nr:HEPN domain-containing protein [Bacteroidales bacterium]